MTIEIRQGNLFNHYSHKVDASIIDDIETKPCIGHGVNSFGAMGAGIAVEFKKRFPEMYAEYNKRCKNGLIFPGLTWAWKEDTGLYMNKNEVLAEDHFWIYNLTVKAHWKMPATYDAVEASLKNMAIHMNENNLIEVALPWIGCGLGGLSKIKVKSLMEKIAEQYKIKIIVYEQ